MLSEFTDIICKQLNVNELIIKPTSLLKKTFKPNKTMLGRAFKKESKKYEEMILSGNIFFDGCDDSFYTFEYMIEPKDDFIGTKFTYYDMNGEQTSAVVYLNSTTDEDNDIMAVINNTRRQINNFRKEMGLKSKDKIMLLFDSNEYLNTIDKEYIVLLSDQLRSEIVFIDMNGRDNIKMIETFNNMKLKVRIINL
jgi:hypothetical protein